MAGIALLDDDTIATALSHLDWQRQDDQLVKVHRTPDFAGALALVNRMSMSGRRQPTTTRTSTSVGTP